MTDDDLERWGREYRPEDLAPWWVVLAVTAVFLALVYGGVVVLVHLFALWRTKG